MMYTVATHLVEEKSGLPFAQFLQERFFQPLNMESTNLQPQLARSKGLGDRIAMGHVWDEKTEKYEGFETPDSPEAQGAGSIITSVNDYIKWVKAMMNCEDPITPKVYKGLTKARIIQNPNGEYPRPFSSPVACAAGWDVCHYRGYQLIRHDGSVPGFGSCHFFLPEFKFGGAIFSNSEGGTEVTHILMREFVDHVLNVPEAERPDWNKIETEDAPGDENEDDEDYAKKLREQLCPGLTEPLPQEVPLNAYIGEYWNPGYHTLRVQIKDEKLFIDATDRSMGFTLTFDHVCEQTKYLVHLSDFLEGGDNPLKGEFKLEDNKAVKMGLYFEDELKDYIWFDKIDKKG